MRIRKEDLSISIYFDEEISKWIAEATSSANYTPYKNQVTSITIKSFSDKSASDCLLDLLKQIELE